MESGPGSEPAATSEGRDTLSANSCARMSNEEREAVPKGLRSTAESKSKAPLGQKSTPKGKSKGKPKGSSLADRITAPARRHDPNRHLPLASAGACTTVIRYGWPATGAEVARQREKVGA
ncbi:hypothetical protein MMC24_005952 [Lignoscripta atroalba]|nr:hypothetical protein [Lignoscripta atroalba]